MKKSVYLLVVLSLVLVACVAPAAPAPAAQPAAPAAAPTLAASAPTAAAPAAATGKGYRLYMMAKVAGIPYFELNSKPGAEEAAKELGDTVTFTSPAKPDPTEQIQMIQSAIDQKYDAIMVSADDEAALVPVLKKAMAAGIKVVTWDSDVLPEGRQLFQQQVSPEDFGRTEVKLMCQELGGPGKCSGQVAILSAAATMTNQNTWIKWMMEEWKNPDYANMKYVGTVYGDDVDQKSYEEALGLIKTYPDLKGIISPTTVGCAATARAMEDQGLGGGKVAITGGGLPSQMRKYVKDGTVQMFPLWVPKDQGYLTVYMAHLLITGELKGVPGEKFTAGRLGEKTVNDQNWVVLATPMIFNKDNIDNYDF